VHVTDAVSERRYYRAGRSSTTGTRLAVWVPWTWVSDACAATTLRRRVITGQWRDMRTPSHRPTTGLYGRARDAHVADKPPCMTSLGQAREMWCAGGGGSRSERASECGGQGRAHGHTAVKSLTKSYFFNIGFTSSRRNLF
jgi:hypothetical protein